MNREDFYRELINKIAEQNEDELLNQVFQSDSHIAFGTDRFHYEVRYQTPERPFEIRLAFASDNLEENKQLAEITRISFKEADIHLEAKENLTQKKVHLIYATHKHLDYIPTPHETAEMVLEAFAVTPQKTLDWALD